MAKKKKKRPAAKKQFGTHGASRLPDGFRLVKSNDTFRYQCSLCGDCCRNVQDAVMLESLDLYRLVKYLRESGREVQGIDETILEYAHPMFLGGADYYPILLLNSSGPENQCVFLKGNRCTIQPVKPRACRLYPLSAGPNNMKGDFEYVIVSQKPHHFTGPEIRAGDWMDENFNEEDRSFVLLDVKSAGDLAPILRRLKQLGVDENRVLSPFIFFKYFAYNLDEPFLPQFSQNMAALKKTLANMLEHEEKTIQN